MNLVFDENFVFIFVTVSLFIFLVVTLCMLLLKNISRIEEMDIPQVVLNEEGFPILEDLRKIIAYECNKAIKLEITYLTVRNTLGMDHTKSLYGSRILSSEKIDEITIRVTTKILDYLSEGFKERIFKVIRPEHLELFITEEVYEILIGTVYKLN